MTLPHQSYALQLRKNDSHLSKLNLKSGKNQEQNEKSHANEDKWTETLNWTLERSRERGNVEFRRKVVTQMQIGKLFAAIKGKVSLCYEWNILDCRKPLIVWVFLLPFTIDLTFPHMRLRVLLRLVFLFLHGIRIHKEIFLANGVDPCLLLSCRVRGTQEHTSQKDTHIKAEKLT